LFRKIIETHYVSGEMKPGKEVAIKIDQTLTQDSLGTMAYLLYEAMGKEKVETELSVSYVDHLMLQLGQGNADVHRYLETVADRFGIIYSKAGNGICHQVHLERFSKPGKTLIGSDSHTVTCGAAGMVAFGAGGLDVALAMSGVPFRFVYPYVMHIVLEGVLPEWVTAKDIALAVLGRIKTKGNTNTVIEYGGTGVQTLSIPQRATIANMGAEAGVTTSIFPSDKITRAFLTAQERENDWKELYADRDAFYDDELMIDLSTLEPYVAFPHSPDRVVPVSEIKGLKVNQVLIGSCTNSSYQDIMNVAHILKGKKINPEVSLGIAFGSRQVLSMVSETGALTWLIDSGARILETGCGFCVGMGQSPETGAVSVRTSNRNYKGRSGTQDAQVYLVSPETAAATAITGELTDPRTLDIEYPNISMPTHMKVDDSMLMFPTGKKEIFRSKLIGQPPVNTAMPDCFIGEVVIKVGDAINTDDIIPGGLAMNYRANIKKSCEFLFRFIDKNFHKNCVDIKARNRIPIIVAGFSYGQGSSREHAALCPMVLGVRCVLAKSIERIHQANLVNYGILPLLFKNHDDYEHIGKGDILSIENIFTAVKQDIIEIKNKTKQEVYKTINGATERQRQIILEGGLLNTIYSRQVKQFID
jgi:aconitate hydratase